LKGQVGFEKLIFERMIATKRLRFERVEVESDRRWLREG
jgi:hypothetical protein